MARPAAKTPPPLDADVLIIGAGVCGSIIAKELALKLPGARVLVIEAGASTAVTPEGYASYVERFHSALIKIPNAPFPDSSYAPAPTVLQFNAIPPGTVDAAGYYAQAGPLPFSSEYDRTAGGTSQHWLGQTPRMLPNDFRMKSVHGVGVDWPISYEDLRPYYERAEFELGVSGSAAEQWYPGVDMSAYYGGYRFPMRKMPQSFGDESLKPLVEGVKLDSKHFPKSQYPYPFQCIPTPQARNGEPEPAYVNPETGRRGYSPVGAAGTGPDGERCQGNASCTPICPVQAKYNALKTFAAARRSDHVRVLTQTVATRVNFDAATGDITGIETQAYSGCPGPKQTLRARLYVLAAHTIENTKLLLNSGVPDTSGQLGRNLMDNPVMLGWGLFPKPLGYFRGPGSTTNISTFRDGPFRRDHASFILPLDNWGWIWPTGAPNSTLATLLASGWPLVPPGGTAPKDGAIPAQQMFGRTLRDAVGQAVSSQVFIHFEMDQPPDPANRVTVNPSYRDALGLPRPFFRYNLSDYMKRTFAVCDRIRRQMFAQMGVQDFTQYHTYDPGYFEFEGTGYSFNGAGHITGTHRMGATARTSVVDPTLRAWDHRNLFLVSGGAMPTIGSSNPTLTTAALAYRAADEIRRELAPG